MKTYIELQDEYENLKKEFQQHLRLKNLDKVRTILKKMSMIDRAQINLMTEDNFNTGPVVKAAAL